MADGAPASTSSRKARDPTKGPRALVEGYNNEELTKMFGEQASRADVTAEQVSQMFGDPDVFHPGREGTRPSRWLLALVYEDSNGTRYQLLARRAILGVGETVRLMYRMDRAANERSRLRVAGAQRVLGPQPDDVINLTVTPKFTHRDLPRLVVRVDSIVQPPGSRDSGTGSTGLATCTITGSF